MSSLLRNIHKAMTRLAKPSLSHCLFNGGFCNIESASPCSYFGGMGQNKGQRPHHCANTRVITPCRTLENGSGIFRLKQDSFKSLEILTPGAPQFDRWPIGDQSNNPQHHFKPT